MRILDGKVAIVTGSTRGIGRAEAIALAKEGAAVAIIANEETSHAVAEIESMGARAIGIYCDVRRSEDVQNAVDQTVKAFGGVDILVNNAQKISSPHPMEEWTVEEMTEHWESGPLGTWLFMKACFPHLKKEGGSIINTCSGVSYGYLFGYTGYAATKEAIRSLTRQASKEWGDYNIRVNVIAPAALTPGATTNMDEALEKKILSTKAIKRWGDAEKDVGRVVVFLAGPDSTYMTGNTIAVNGGFGLLV